MRNLVLGVAAVSILAVSFAGDSPGQSPSPSGTPLPLEQRVNDLEKRIQALEDIPAVAMALKLRASTPGNTPAQTESTPASQPDSPLELVSWKYQFKRGQYAYQSRHMFTYVLKNRSEKPIKLVDGTLVFTDLLGEKLIAIKLDPDVKYPSGAPASASGAWDVNQFESGQGRMTTMNHDDVKATLVIRKVVFGDNSVWSAASENAQ